MKTKLIIVLIIYSGIIFSQEKTTKDSQNIKVVTDSEPAYVKGEQQLYMDVLYNVKYPEEAIKKYVEGNVHLSFYVKTDSTVTNCIIISGVDKATDEAVSNYVKTLKFIPAKQNGVVVKMNTMYTFPVKAH